MLNMNCITFVLNFFLLRYILDPENVTANALSDQVLSFPEHKSTIKQRFNLDNLKN